MILTLVTFPSPATSAADSRALLEATAPAYRKIPGLRRKYFIGDGALAGGVYEWADRDSAERFYSGDWRQRMWDRYAIEPAVQFFSAPCLVDNVAGRIEYDLPDSVA